jgi:hypothetical protein
MNSIDNYSFNYNLLEQNSLFINEKPTSYSDGIIYKGDDENDYELKKKEIPNDKKEKMKRGRKRTRGNNNKSDHNKFSDDNIRRKIKSLLLKYTLKFINDRIYSMYNGNIGQGIYKKQLKTIEQSQVSNATIEFNQKLLKKTLGEIFSKDISGKYTNFCKEQNKLVIQSLRIKEEDENKREYFKRLFNLTFTDCLKQFRGDEHFEELEGLKLFDNINEILFKYLNKYTDGKEYIKELRYYLQNYENITNTKKGKKRKKKYNNKLDQNN